MATNDPEFYQSPKFTAEPPPPAPRERGCFFYGCIIATVLIVLCAVFLAIGSYLVYRTLKQGIEEYTATAPRELPKLAMTADERQAVKDRFEAFRKAVEAGTPTESLVLTSDDLNALIEENDDLRGLIHIAIEGDKVKGQISLPLEKLGIPMVKGRYLNGEADLKASLSDGVLIVTIDSFEVNGKQPPENMLTQLRQQNLAKDVYKNPRNAEMIRKLESLEIKDGKIIIKVRSRPDSSTDDQKKQSLPVDVVAPPAKPDQPKTEPATPGSSQPKGEAASTSAPAVAPKP